MENEPNSKYPLVSVICFCRNGVKTIRRCIEGILVQDYPNIEVIVQDGASTDGTLEILREYGDKIKLVSEPDNGPNDAMFRCFCRMKGEFFVTSLADEAMLSHAVSWGVENLQNHPEVAAIYSDHYVTDIDGKITGMVRAPQWNFESYFCSDITPPFCTSFFRRSCYEKIGFTEYTASDEFDLWINIGVRFPIRYMPCEVPLAKYATHMGSISFTEQHQTKRLASRKRAIQKLCDDPTISESIRSLCDKALASTYVWHVISFCCTSLWDQVKRDAPQAFKVGPNPEKLLQLAKLIYAHIVELRQKGALQEAIEFLDMLEKCKVTAKEFDCQREQILQKTTEINKAANYLQSQNRFENKKPLKRVNSQKCGTTTSRKLFKVSEVHGFKEISL